MKSTSNKYATSFGLFAKTYQKYRRSYSKPLYQLLFSLINQQDLSILDVGCGTGKSTEPLLLFKGKRNISVTGIDPDPAMLHEARASAKKKKLPITYLQGTASTLPFKKESFDAVISGAAFHWFGDKRSLAKIKNVLKKDGVFFIFWTQFTHKNRAVVGKEIFGKYKWKAIPKDFREQTFVSNLLNQAGLRDVGEATLPFSEKISLEQVVGLWKTNSSYALLTPALRHQFNREMTAAYRAALGKKEFMTEHKEFRICYGFK
jgi:ubiquinone/menaquinone biosynthesis C-methylase UbiE